MLQLTFQSRTTCSGYQEAIADDSNLAENSEYQAVKAEQEFNEARAAELEDKLARAEVIDVSKFRRYY